jgi:hypothetical protein
MLSSVLNRVRRRDVRLGITTLNLSFLTLQIHKLSTEGHDAKKQQYQHGLFHPAIASPELNHFFFGRHS